MRTYVARDAGMSQEDGRGERGSWVSVATRKFSNLESLLSRVSKLVTAAMAAGVLVIASQSPSVAASSLSVSRSAVIAGESVSVRGSTGIKVARPVLLERKSGTRWVKITSAHTTRTGSFAFTFKPSGSTGTKTTVRVRAPRVKIK